MIESMDNFTAAAMFAILLATVMVAIFYIVDLKSRLAQKEQDLPEFRIAAQDMQSIVNYVYAHKSLEDVVDKNPMVVAQMFYLEWLMWIKREEILHTMNEREEKDEHIGIGA